MIDSVAHSFSTCIQSVNIVNEYFLQHGLFIHASTASIASLIISYYNIFLLTLATLIITAYWSHVPLTVSYYWPQNAQFDFAVFSEGDDNGSHDAPKDQSNTELYPQSLISKPLKILCDEFSVPPWSAAVEFKAWWTV